jgi:signal transduction histidine kinase/ligand-binding sensor domain-containing protein
MQPQRIIPNLLIICLLLTGCNQATPLGLEVQPNPITSEQEGNRPNSLPDDLPLEAIRFTHLTGEDGISQSTINCMLQDSYGYIWLGTEDGLNKLGGRNVTVFKNDPDDPFSLTNNSITTIVETEGGNLWIGTRGGGLNYYSRETGNFASYRFNTNVPNSLSSDYIESLAIANDGTVWIGTNGGGLDRYDPGTNTFQRYLNRSTGTSISSNIVHALAIDQDGAIWIGTSYGLDRYDPARDAFSNFRSDNTIPIVMSRSGIYSLLADESGLWVGTEAGLFQMNSETSQVKNIQLNSINEIAPRIPIRSILKMGDGDLWIGTEEFGLFFLPSGKTIAEQILADHRNPNAISDNSILSSLVDASGIIWLGTKSGFVNQIDPLRHRFNTLMNSPWKENSISPSKIWAITIDANNRLWIGTDGGGLNRVDLFTGKIQYFIHTAEDASSIDDDHVRSFYLDSEGKLWIGTNKGLNQYHEADDTFFHIPIKKMAETDIDDSNMSSSIIQSPILVITQSDDGFLWIGTESSGLYKLNPKTGETENIQYLEGFSNSIAGNTVQSLLVDRPSILWIGTDRGLTRLDMEMNYYRTYTTKSNNRGNLSDNRVLSIHRSTNGTLWIGTGSGLNRFDEGNGVFIPYREEDGLPNDSIKSIREDQNGNLWLSTNKGISRFNQDNGVFVNYDLRDGLPEDEFISGSAATDREGNIYFGGINGITHFQPGDVGINSFSPVILLSSLTQGGSPLYERTPIETVGKVNLIWPKNYFEFTFQNQAFSQTGKYQYAYRLYPFEKEWVRSGDVGAGRYTNLPGGTYSLAVRSTDSQGGWTSEKEILKITVVPPVWENRWFLILAGLVVFGLVSTGILLRTRSMQKRNRELMALVAERTKEIDQRRQVAEGLRDVLVRINSNQSIDNSLEFIANRIRLSVGSDAVFIAQMYGDHPASEDFFIRSTDGDFPFEVKKNDIKPILKAVRVTGKAVFSRVDGGYAGNVSDIPDEGNLQGMPFAALPVVLEDKLEAVLLILTEETRNWSEEEKEIFTSFADQIALALGNARLHQKAADLAMMNERNRLARDLHDAVTQTLFSASLLAEAFPSVWENNPQEGKKLIQEMRQLTRGALAEMRSLLMELRPSAMAEAKLQDLLKQLSEAVIGRTGLEIKLELDPILHLSSEVNICLYRIAQEALTNIVKHAHANKVWIRCTAERNISSRADMGAKTNVTMQVEDDGCGFEAKAISPDHFGLYNIRERANGIGAQVEIQSKPGCGTIVTVRWQGEEVREDE